MRAEFRSVMYCGTSDLKGLKIGRGGGPGWRHPKARLLLRYFHGVSEDFPCRPSQGGVIREFFSKGCCEGFEGEKVVGHDCGGEEPIGCCFDAEFRAFGWLLPKREFALGCHDRGGACLLEKWCEM